MIEEQAQQIAEQWLTEAAESAGKKDLQGHMGMISKRISVQGVPGFENIDSTKYVGSVAASLERAGGNGFFGARNRAIFTQSGID